MIKISGFQLFVLTLFFQIGSTIIFGFGTSAGRNAWIAAFVSNGLGILVILLYILLQRLQPELTLVQWFPKQFGKWIGIPISWIYPLAFIYVSARVLRDFGDFVTTVLLPNTPQWMVPCLLMMVVAYGLFQGIETLARVCQLAFPFVFLLSAAEILGLVSSNLFEWDRLFPVMGQGWKQIWQTVFPLNVTVPYGETLAFTMLWPMMNQPKNILKSTLAATILYGGLMVFGDILAVSSLGESIFSRSMYPLYYLLRQINVADFVQNLDAIIVTQAVIVGFFKIIVFTFGAVRGIKQLTGIRNERVFILPITVGVVFLAHFMASNVAEHKEVGLKIVPYFLWIPLFLVLPAILLVVVWIRKKWGKRFNSKQTIQ